VPPSCAAGAAGAGVNCGPNGDQPCCGSPLVPGGSFLRSFDAVTYTINTNPATVSTFRLDRYEVTVGRFRQYLQQNRGTKLNPPVAGSGAHPLVPNTGWDPSWNPSLPNDMNAAEAGLTNDTDCTWTTLPGANENLPINCVDWGQAFGFCAWDGGRLPTEAEWNYAAVGGPEQRVYPWSVPPTATTITPAHAVYLGSTWVAPVGSTSPIGDSKWGHANMTGNVWEWDFDYDGALPNPCVDCINLTPGNPAKRVFHGGAWQWNSTLGLPSRRSADIPFGVHIERGGIRCSRDP
jgi:formylglycine-generating enzyme required for sulfatase activity